MTAPSKPRVNHLRPVGARYEDAMIVDRLLKKLRHADPDLSRDRHRPSQPGALKATRQPIVGPAPREPSWRLPWLWSVLGVMLGVGLLQWPYERACGLALFIYLGAVGALVLTGVLAGVSAWCNRRGVAHVIAILLVVGGLVLAAEVVLPRSGYAKAHATWICGGG